MEFIFISLVSFIMWPGFNKFIYAKLSSKNDIEKVTSEGLYHITSCNAIKQIMESGYFKTSNFTTSFGKRKVFFFAGIPSYNDTILNGIKDIEKQKLVAVKIKPTDEQIKKLKVRKYDDGAIVHTGKLLIEDLNISIAYLILKVNDQGQLYYKEVCEEIYYNHVPSQLVKDKINIKNFLSAYMYQYKLTIHGSVQLLKDILLKFKINRKNKYDNNKIVFNKENKKFYVK